MKIRLIGFMLLTILNGYITYQLWDTLCISALPLCFLVLSILCGILFLFNPRTKSLQGILYGITVAIILLGIYYAVFCRRPLGFYTASLSTIVFAANFICGPGRKDKSVIKILCTVICLITLACILSTLISFSSAKHPLGNGAKIMWGENHEAMFDELCTSGENDEEKAFYELTESAWGITPNLCTSPNHAGSLLLSKMREFAYPVWCLEDVDTNGIYDLVKMYMELVQNTGDKQHDIANNIGKIAMQRPSSADNLKVLLTADNCIKGMKIFLERFENGKLLYIADEIGATDAVLSDIKKLFSVQYSALWIGTTGEDEIRKLTVEYSVVKANNLLLNVSAHSKDGAFKQWRETLKFIGISCEAARTKRPTLDKFFYYLLKIVNLEDMLPENMSSFLDEMTNHSTDIRDVIGNTLGLFMELYAPYLKGFSPPECEEIKTPLQPICLFFLLPRVTQL